MPALCVRAFIVAENGDNTKWFDSSCFQTFRRVLMLHSFFWEDFRRLNFMCRRFGTLSNRHWWLDFALESSVQARWLEMSH
jgi:hypothetical protein